MFDFSSEAYFFTASWISFFLAAIGILGVFFSRRIPYLIYFTTLILSGSLFNILNTSYYLNDIRGEMSALYLIIGYGLEIGTILYLLRKKKVEKFSAIFYILAFMSFFLLATARDLISLIIGLEGFQICLYGFIVIRKRLRPLQLSLLKEGLVSYSALVYGFSVLYLTRGQISLLGLRQSLQSTPLTDSFVLIGLGLFTLGIFIKVNSFITISRKKLPYV